MNLKNKVYIELRLWKNIQEKEQEEMAKWLEESEKFFIFGNTTIII